jgi:hypothetical protein
MAFKHINLGSNDAKLYKIRAISSFNLQLGCTSFNYITYTLHWAEVFSRKLYFKFIELKMFQKKDIKVNKST